MRRLFLQEMWKSRFRKYEDHTNESWFSHLRRYENQTVIRMRVVILIVIWSILSGWDGKPLCCHTYLSYREPGGWEDYLPALRSWCFCRWINGGFFGTINQEVKAMTVSFLLNGMAFEYDEEKNIANNKKARHILWDCSQVFSGLWQNRNVWWRQ